MKVGVFSTVFRDQPFETMLDQVSSLGLSAVELGTGNWPGDSHCKPDELLSDSGKLKRFKSAIESRGLKISALSQHGNPVHPDEAVSKRDHEVFLKTLKLAEALEVQVVNGFSGCPGSTRESKFPNWVTCAWPPEFRDVLDWQWKEVLVPYWQDQVPLLEKHGVKIGIELHPGYNVYNPETLLRLREETSPLIGANYDPSHLFWQGIDPLTSIKLLGSSIHHVHAKDTFIDKANVAANGVLDTKPYTDLANRSWYFRSVGYGQGDETWKTIVSALRLVGYDYVLSIEHEDGMLSMNEGLSRAAKLLLEICPDEKPVNQWWA